MVYLAYLFCKTNISHCFSSTKDYGCRELFLGNLVGQLMRRPEDGDIINKVEDLVEHNITIFEDQQFYYNTQAILFDANITEWDHVANTMVPSLHCPHGAWGSLQ